MRVIAQRVSMASVIVNDNLVNEIESGLLVLLGIGHEDEDEDVEWLCKKLLNMRIFSDEQGKMNKSIVDITGQILVISQFTLFASTKKGNRPSFMNSAKPEKAESMYTYFCNRLRELQSDIEVKTGIFAADMKVNLINDGPVTIILDSKNKE